MRCAIWVACVGLVATGCSKKNQDGLPPATEWNAAPEVAPAKPFKKPSGMGARASGDPHAGLGIDVGGAGDPHAGLDMSNPHGGGGVDVTQLGLAPPDPDRAINAANRVAGVLHVDAKAKSRLKMGTAVFLVVKRAGPDGAPSGPPLAVEKLAWVKDGMPFELTEANAMVANTELTGDVIVTARYDQDSDALTKEPGDVTGQTRVKVPASNVKVMLETVL